MTISSSPACFIHAGISVADRERAIAWYEKYFGCSVVKRFEKPDLEIRGAVLQLGTATLELLEVRRPHHTLRSNGSLVEELRNIGVNHLAIGVADCTAWFERLRKEGAELITPLLGGTMFFCKDPDGTLLEIKQG